MKFSFVIGNFLGIFVCISEAVAKNLCWLVHMFLFPAWLLGHVSWQHRQRSLTLSFWLQGKYSLSKLHMEFTESNFSNKKLLWMWWLGYLPTGLVKSSAWYYSSWLLKYISRSDAKLLAFSPLIVLPVYFLSTGSFRKGGWYFPYFFFFFFLNGLWTSLGIKEGWSLLFMLSEMSGVGWSWINTLIYT